MKKISLLTVILALASFSFAQSNTQEVKSVSQESKTVMPVVETPKTSPKKQFDTEAIQHKDALNTKEKKELFIEPKDSRLNGGEDEKRPSDAGSRE